MWTTVGRPGYFGRRRDEKIMQLNEKYGAGNWRLGWDVKTHVLDFFNACRSLYEESYFRYLWYRGDEVELICQYVECFDNSETNVHSGLDYMIQEAYSTHIQDIAVRNVLRRMGRWFEGKNGKLLQIRSKDSEGFRFGPGNIPFFDQALIIQPSMCPSWASAGSVEDYWQSSKVLQVKG